MRVKCPVRTVAQINQTAAQEDPDIQCNGVHDSANQRRNLDVLVPSSFRKHPRIVANIVSETVFIACACYICLNYNNADTDLVS